MQHFDDRILYKTHQHIFVLLSKILSIFVPYAGFIILLGFLEFEEGQWSFDISVLTQIVLIVLGGALITFWFYFFWSKSYFIISNEKIIVKVRNGIFSKFHMSIHFKNIRDMAFSKNNILHYLLNYGTIFARSSAGAMGDLEAKHIPKVEKVYRILNALHSMEDSERKQISNIKDIVKPLGFSKGQVKEAANGLSGSGSEAENSSVDFDKKKDESLEQIIQKEKNILLGIQGLKEVVLLDGTDRKNIFSLEEERNHGVFESLRKKVLFAATHDASLRDPDEAIVLKAGEKIVFPSVKFHEIDRPSVVSSSPGLAVHEYLVPKFHDFDEYDATLLIGFDI